MFGCIFRCYDKGHMGYVATALFLGQQLYIGVDYFPQDVRPHVTVQHLHKPQAMFGKHTKALRQSLTESHFHDINISLSIKRAAH